MKITFFRGLTDEEHSELKKALDALPFRVSLRKATQKKFSGGVHLLPHKSSSPNRRWTENQFNAVRDIVDRLNIEETGSKFLHTTDAHYILAGGLWYLMKVSREIEK